MRIWVLALIVTSSCSHTAAVGPASAPVSVWTRTDDYAWLAPGSCGESQPGVWVVNRAAAERIVQREIGDDLKCKLSVLEQSSRAELAEAKAKQLGEAAAKQDWWSTYGFPLGVATGGVLAVATALGLFFATR